MEPFNRIVRAVCCMIGSSSMLMKCASFRLFWPLSPCRSPAFFFSIAFIRCKVDKILALIGNKTMERTNHGRDSLANNWWSSFSETTRLHRLASSSLIRLKCKRQKAKRHSQNIQQNIHFQNLKWHSATASILVFDLWKLIEKTKDTKELIINFPTCVCWHKFVIL